MCHAAGDRLEHKDICGREILDEDREPEASLAFRQFFNFFVFLIFGHLGTWIAEFSPQNPSPGRKFHAESDFRVKTKKFWRPGAKNEEKPKISKKKSPPNG